MKKINQTLLKILFFLIPTNLAFHFIHLESYVHGMQVDYLIPKLYLSDIPLLLILAIWLVQNWKRMQKESVSFSLPTLLPWMLAFIVFAKSLLSSASLASIWYWFKLLEFSLFFFWMKQDMSLKIFRKLLYTPLILSLGLQSLLGIYQFIAQKSLAGYWFLGETTLSLSSQIDKIHLSGWFPWISGDLLIPAYGTTPHSNVLGGFLVVGIMLLVYLYPKTIARNVVIVLSGIALLLTFSVSAWIGLLISLLSQVRYIQKGILYFTNLFVVFSPFLLSLLDKLAPSTSAFRRIELLQITKNMIGSTPLLGVGLNNFTVFMGNFGEVVANTRFLQPVHNVLYLWLAETGVIGLFLLVWVIMSLYKKMQFQMIGLLVLLLWLGSLDHYLLTLQTGQLLAVLGLWLVVQRTNPSMGIQPL